MDDHPLRIEQTHGNLVFGFDAQFGFYVVNHSRRRAAYAYPSSPNARQAMRDRLAVALTMSNAWSSAKSTALASIEERHYLHVVETCCQS